MMMSVRLAAAALAATLAGCGAPEATNDAQEAGAASDNVGLSLWDVHQTYLEQAKYIDLTHAFEPVQAVWGGFGRAQFRPAAAQTDMGDYAAAGDEFTYDAHGFIATEYLLPTDQYGTQFDPPAHWNDMGATISDIPASFAIHPLVVIDVSEKVAADEGYHLQVSDVEAWEAEYDRIPEGAVVMVRSDWHKRWGEVDRFNQKPFPGVGLEALKFLHAERGILFHGHEPLDTDTTPNLEGEHWLMHNNYAQAEGVKNLHLVPEQGGLIMVGFAKPLGGSGGFARYIAVAPPDWPHGETIADIKGKPLPVQDSPLRRDANGVLRPGGVPAALTVAAAPYCEINYSARPHSKAVERLGADRVAAVRRSQETFDGEQDLIEAFDNIATEIFSLFGIAVDAGGDLAIQTVFGGYKGETSPSLAMRLPIGDSLSRDDIGIAAAGLGYVFMQESVLVQCTPEPEEDGLIPTFEVTERGPLDALNKGTLKSIYGMMIGEADGDLDLGFTYRPDQDQFTVLGFAENGVKDREILGTVVQTLQTLSGDDHGVFLTETARWVTFPSNNWEAAPNGDGYVQAAWTPEQTEGLNSLRDQFIEQLDAYFAGVSEG